MKRSQHGRGDELLWRTSTKKCDEDDRVARSAPYPSTEHQCQFLQQPVGTDHVEMIVT